ncbi:ligase-associated DNA damage response endonuclease PdeM [Albimonas sp. CAU 1670]|uniref:ligase-associated DNA damage response endonuclease PdeM n=1 Tax=Albimonas sp. CAU 1670 TaxID=3032599 RepID=UPI0023DA61E2|nr:ligase-associated DNA damage response endonuclease PdeM [Albimonas sp. CAU 1670]MDF2231372.1 ligase-associated DNA damage response endonuclease PdeM [Albimonas sp. CAU 1670]
MTLAPPRPSSPPGPAPAAPSGALSATLAGETLEARPSGALWWPARRLLTVSDLHLGKSERIARRGGALLPPYETQDTLDRLAEEIAALAPATMVCLGDSFDDLASAALPEAEATRLAAMMAGRRWIWIEGNHDPGPVPLGGEHLAELREGPLVFRHEAHLDVAEPGEISGHYHPKARLRGGARRCFVLSPPRLILPAFGRYTGGLDVGSEALRRVAPRGLALLAGARVVAAPLDRLRG